VKYFRFGQIPENEKSLNWFRLSFDEQSDVSFALSMGDDLENALWKARVDENREGLFENGVSVFKADKNGMPVIENLQQLASMAARIGKAAYTMTGEEVGKGTDGEPIIRNISEITEASATTQALEEKVVEVLEANYTRIEKLDYTSSEIYIGAGSVCYKGCEYFDPVDGWNTAIGYHAYR